MHALCHLLLTISQPPQPLASKFFVFMAFMVLCQQAAVSLAQAVSAICRDVDTSGGLGGVLTPWVGTWGRVQVPQW